MHDERLLLQPGAMFLAAWRGCMMVQGMTLADWARQNDISQQVLRQIATGTINGPKGKAVREKMIEAAGRELLVKAIADRWQREIAQ